MKAYDFLHKAYEREKKIAYFSNKYWLGRVTFYHESIRRGGRQLAPLKFCFHFFAPTISDNTELDYLSYLFANDESDETAAVFGGLAIDVGDYISQYQLAISISPSGTQACFCRSSPPCYIKYKYTVYTQSPRNVGGSKRDS